MIPRIERKASKNKAIFCFLKLFLIADLLEEWNAGDTRQEQQHHNKKEGGGGPISSKDFTDYSNCME